MPRISTHKLFGGGEFKALNKSIDSTVTLDDLILITEDAGVLFAIGRLSQ